MENMNVCKKISVMNGNCNKIDIHEKIIQIKLFFCDLLLTAQKNRNKIIMESECNE